MSFLDLPTSRQRAFELGSVAYYIGVACKNGHIERRYTNTGVCYECKRKQAQRDYENHPERVNETNKKSRHRNKEKVTARSQAWAAKNKEKSRAIKKAYKIHHRGKYLANAREYNKRKRQDPMFRLCRNLSVAIWRCLKQDKTFKKWRSFVSFSAKELREHLASLFTPEMNWENYGSYWEVDRVKPISKCASFDEAWQLSNLHPLTCTENRRKQAKWQEPETN